MKSNKLVIALPIRKVKLSLVFSVKLQFGTSQNNEFPLQIFPAKYVHLLKITKEAII